MKIELNKIVGLLIIGLSYFLFFNNFNNNIEVSFISIIGMFLIWILWNKFFQASFFNDLIYLIFVTGLVVSVSILSVYGIEPVGTRNGTLLKFHNSQIILAMLVFFFSILPIIIMNLKIKIPDQKFKLNYKNFQRKAVKNNNKNHYIIDDDNWEIISENEAVSGDYYLD
tara:strand:+ start:7779 stop:8285 length:507 start_codon:yes stop_codon:yes gene_type:complete